MEGVFFFPTGHPELVSGSILKTDYATKEKNS